MRAARGAPRAQLTGLGGAGGVLLIASHGATLADVRALAVVVHTVGHRHGPTLLVIGVAVVLAALLAGVRRSRLAMLALALLGLAALLIGAIADHHVVHSTGAYAELYSDTRARPRSGYWLEGAGALLALLAGLALLALELALARRYQR